MKKFASWIAIFKIKFVKIQIKDEGEGISKKDIKHIFERFYKSKNSSENSIGIGLSLAKTIIEKANGYIKVESEEGKGTLFEIKYLKWLNCKEKIKNSWK